MSSTYVTLRVEKWDRFRLRKLNPMEKILRNMDITPFHPRSVKRYQREAIWEVTAHMPPWYRLVNLHFSFCKEAVELINAILQAPLWAGLTAVVGGLITVTVTFWVRGLGYFRRQRKELHGFDSQIT